MKVVRCGWARNEPAVLYHDTEWGVPVYDDRTLFEFLILEGAQAGLSWDTILRKRDRYREVFHGFDPARVAKMTHARLEKILQDPGVVRNRLKVAAAVTNARAFLAVQREYGTFAQYVWPFVGGKTIRNARKAEEPAAATSPESDALSKDLKRRGFTFVGSTIMYAFMQATGLVNDHAVQCFRYRQVGK